MVIGRLNLPRERHAGKGDRGVVELCRRFCELSGGFIRVHWFGRLGQRRGKLERLLVGCGGLRLNHYLCGDRHRLAFLRSQRLGLGSGVVSALPVDHAIDEVDRVPVGREGHQNAAVANRVSDRIIKLGLEPDRRAVGDDLHVMIGQARQQRPARDVRDCPHVVVEAAFIANGSSDIGDRGVVVSASEVEQDAVACEILDVVGLEVLDGGKVAAAQERDPMVVGADMHPPLVGADCGRDVIRLRGFLCPGQVELGRIFPKAVHRSGTPRFPHSADSLAERRYQSVKHVWLAAIAALAGPPTR